MLRRKLVNLSIIFSILLITTITFVSITRIINVIRENESAINSAYRTVVENLFDTLSFAGQKTVPPDEFRAIVRGGEEIADSIERILSMELLKTLQDHFPELDEMHETLDSEYSRFRAIRRQSEQKDFSTPEQQLSAFVNIQHKIADSLSSFTAWLMKYMQRQEYYYRLIYIFYIGGIAVVVFLMIQQNRTIKYQQQHSSDVQELSDKIIESQELERQRIALDLHDTIAQELSALMLSIETMTDGIEGDVSGEYRKNVRKRIKKVSRETKDILVHVRQISYDLRPPVLSEFGFEKALYNMYEHFSARTGIDCYYSSSESEQCVLTEKKRINLYRAVQEVLTNVEKHSGAGRVYLDVQYSDPSLMLIIQDDGNGFQPEKVNGSGRSHMGLRGIEERVRLCDGTVSIQSRRDKGTIVTIEVPAEKADTRREN